MLLAALVLEFDTPEDLLSNEESAFAKMVQSTGAANTQYLKKLVFADKSNKEETKRRDGQRRWLASSRWAAAAQFALTVSLTSSQNDLQRLEIEDQPYQSFLTTVNILKIIIVNNILKEVFTCAKDWGLEALMKELDCVRMIFHVSKDFDGKELEKKTDDMLTKLGKKQISHIDAIVDNQLFKEECFDFYY